jgi:hypothetical protein
MTGLVTPSMAARPRTVCGGGGQIDVQQDRQLPDGQIGSDQTDMFKGGGMPKTERL